MSDRVSAFDVAALGVNRQVMRWFANYVFVLWYAFSAWVGELALALVGILCIELVNTFWRYVPRQATNMPDPTPARWRAPMRAARLYMILWHIGALASGAFVITIVLVVIAVVARPSHLGAGNLVVVFALGLWLVTRPIWFPRFARAVLSVWQQLERDSRPTGGAKLSFTTDGIDVAVPPQLRISTSVRPSWSWHFAFAEITELRTLSDTEAASYMVGAMEYDPTIAVRANVDLARYAKGDIQRPAIYMGVRAKCSSSAARNSSTTWASLRAPARRPWRPGKPGPQPIRPLRSRGLGISRADAPARPRRPPRRCSPGSAW